MLSCSALTVCRSSRLLIAISLALFCLSASVFAQSTATVRIGSQFTVGMGDYADIAITLENVQPGFAMGGFDFLLSYDSDAISLENVEPGQILNDCRWEYFSFRTGPSPVCSDSLCTEEVVRIVAVAETNNGPIHPSCFGENPGVLINLRFRTAFNMHYEYYPLPISWIWQDCGDNSIASTAGDSLWISSDVYDFTGTLITQEQSFPTLLGANSSCDPSGPRLIDFHGGVIEIGVGWPGWDDYRGDVDFDGVAFEANDYDLFATYFVYGLSVFTIDIGGQISASDANYDGLALTLPDLIYLYRVYHGEVSLYGKRSVSDTVRIFQDTVSNRIWIEYPDSLSALDFYIDSSIVPAMELPTHTLLYDTRPTNTSVLIIPETNYGAGVPTIPDGFSLYYSGEGVLTAATATYDGLAYIPVQLMFSTNCCMNRGNTDGSSDGNIDISDLTFFVRFLFANASAPPCIGEGDVDGSGQMDISDLTFLVDYLFNGGPPPSEC